MPTQPQQPIVLELDVEEQQAHPRFQANAVVRYLYDEARRRQLFTLDQIWDLPFSREDLRQFYQLIGYSIVGYGEIFHAPEDEAHTVEIDRQANILGLNAAVTKAIQEAEGHDRKHEDHPFDIPPDAESARRAAWREVATLERRLAEQIPVTDLEGQVARRGVVTALLRAGDAASARAAAAMYVLDKDAPPLFATAMAQIPGLDVEAAPATAPRET